MARLLQDETAARWLPPDRGTDARFGEQGRGRPSWNGGKQGSKSNPHSFSVNRKIRAFIYGLRVISNVHQM